MVSIVLVTYNRSERLRLSIQDILDQTFRDFELIICDDCSPDSTQQICQEFAAKDKRIRYYRNSNNLRMPANLNQGIELATYEYVAILHDADRYKPDLIELWHKALVENPNVAFAFYQHTSIDDRGEIVHTYQEPFEGVVQGTYLLRQVFFRRWRFDSPVFGMAMGRKSLFKEAGMFNSAYGFYADVDMWMSLLHKWDAFYVSKPVILSYIETRQFDDNMWKISSMIKEMHTKHRKIEFSESSWLRQVTEQSIYYFYSYKLSAYHLLLNFKKHDLKNLLLSKNFIQKDTFFLMSLWLILIILYPFFWIISFPNHIVKKYDKK